MPYSNPDADSLQFLANHTEQAIFVLDAASLHFTYLNPAFLNALKLNQDSGLAFDAVLNMIHEEDQQYVQEAYQQLLEGQELKELEFRVDLPEHGERWMCLRPFLKQGEAGRQQVVGYVEDVTAARQYNDYLKKFANKKDSVLHVLGHDLAGPLGIIQSLSGVMADELKANKSEELEKLIGLIGKTSAHAVKLIKSFINHEFLATTGVDTIKRRVNIVKRFEEIIDQYRYSAEEIDKTFEFYASSDKIYALLDDVKFMQAVNNLISNAVKFTPAGGIIQVGLEEQERTVLVKVADNGIGIPQRYHQVLYDTFTQARRPGLKGEPTTGLGMSIVKTIVEWHKGQVWFKSEEGEGTTFYIEIPKY
ncbi:two-component system sensor histidine kinase VicK [Pontibacter ummariensis]|uniref:histidine kinase n=1 Tax=Pontibacter ummariensis TaxID=1610492 RepID=A0A239HWT5_9BACT|nr:PAS domain-containing sensor histidine kinase [Pontibacter ummariensis]PRY10101.1 two-component system sensor histidine kinase VicK [Pontibacter ummariensis]SNS85850.1 two-component system, OmpR family, sensor histidine kinase VicK [Pontibacter ummariensis]